MPTIATSIMLMESGVHENFGIRMELFGCEPGRSYVMIENDAYECVTSHLRVWSIYGQDMLSVSQGLLWN